MSKADKLIEQMRNNPRDWRIEQLESIARARGLAVRKPGGSHVIFQKDGSPVSLSVPAKKPIKPIYIRHFLELLDG